MAETVYINNYATLAAFRNLVNAGVGTDKNSTGIVQSDIDMNEDANWTPIGTGAVKYGGSFNGNNYIISNLTINNAADYKGLFGYTNGATIQNVQIRNANIDAGANDQLGALCGWTDETNISNCNSTGIVATTGDDAGGLVGILNSNSTITNCYSECTVNGSTDIGGLIGQHSGTSSITKSYATGNITATGVRVGGLVGFNSASTITKCYAIGNTSGASADKGGLVGINLNGTIRNCYATGSAIGTDDIGGLVGQHTSTSSTHCHAIGLVNATAGDEGGVAGVNAGTITQCYYNSSTTGQSDTGKGVPIANSDYTNKNSFPGFDFEKTWFMGKSYPLLRAFQPDITLLDRNALFQTNYINTVSNTDTSEQIDHPYLSNLMPFGTYIDESPITNLSFNPESCVVGGIPLSISAFRGVLSTNPSDPSEIYYAFDIIEYIADNVVDPNYVSMDTSLNTEEFAFQNTKYIATFINNKYYWAFAIDAAPPTPEKKTIINGIPMAISSLEGLIMNRTTHNFDDLTRTDPSNTVGELIEIMVGGLPLTVGRVGNKYYLVIHRFIG